MKKAWIFQGGWDGHEPKLTSKRFKAMLEKHGYEVTIQDSLEAAEDAEALMGLDLIVACWTMGTITWEQCQNISKAVAHGTGLAGCHGGMCDSFRENTEWHNIVAWRQSADVAEKFIRKGTQVFIEGRLRTRSYTDAQGTKKYTTEITVDNLQLLGKREGDQGGYPAAAPQQPAYQPQQPAYQAPQPAYQAPQPAYQAPQPAYQPQQPAYQAPKPAAPVQAPQPEVAPIDLGIDGSSDDLPF